MKREDLPLVTPEQFKRFKPCWLRTAEGRARYERVVAKRAEWNALDVLDLEDVSGDEKLWAVLREAFLPPMLLHEFACRCAEWALSFIDSPDPSSVEAIRVKRRWMAGDATDRELAAAWAAARAAAEAAAWAAAEAAAVAAVEDAARAAEFTAVWYARRALALANERASAVEHEIAMLRALIDEWE